MDALTAIAALKALDCLSTRATVTAQNIANAGTPNYRPLKVTFEAALAAAAGQGSDAVEAVCPRIEPSIDPAGGTGLRLDLEMETASSTAARYAALIDILSRRMQMHSMAVTGNG